MADTVIIDIQVSNAEAVKELEQSTAAIRDLKKEEEELNSSVPKVGKSSLLVATPIR